MTQIVRPRDAAELAVLMPYQLGFHPGPSVCLTLMRERRLGLLQRHDLVAEPDVARRVAAEAVAIALREGASSVLLMAFEDDEGQSLALRAAMTAAALEAGLPVHQHLVVRDGHCHTVDGPGAGRALRLPRPEDVPAVAPFVEAGVCPVPSRDHLVRGVLAERDETRAAAVAVAASPLGVRPRVPEIATAWTRLLDPDAGARPVGDLADRDLLVIARSLQLVPWRDALLAVLCPGTMPLTGVDEHWISLALEVTRWCPWVLGDDELVPEVGEHHDGVLAVRTRLLELARLVPAELTPPLLTCAAHLAWWTGDGTVTGVCLERALQVDPDYRLAELMLELLSHGVRPWETPRVA